MIELHNLTSLVKKRKRVGRGGKLGGTSGKGIKVKKLVQVDMFALDLKAVKCLYIVDCQSVDLIMLNFNKKYKIVNLEDH